MIINCDALYRAYQKKPYDTWIKVHALISEDYMRGFGLNKADAQALATAELNHRLISARMILPPEGKKGTKNHVFF